MNGQLQLVDTPVEPKLTPRQARALEHVHAAGAAGIHPDELGALLHAEYRKHGVDERCHFCGATGISILKALRKKGLAKYRRGTVDRPGYWYPVGAAKRDEMPPGMTDEIPF